MSSHQEHTDEEVTTLFERLEAKFPTEGLGQDKWYLVAVRAKPLRLGSALHEAQLRTEAKYWIVTDFRSDWWREGRAGR